MPKALQDAVWSTWRRVRRDPHAYRDAKDEAIRAVNAKLAAEAAHASNQGRLI